MIATSELLRLWSSWHANRHPIRIWQSAAAATVDAIIARDLGRKYGAVIPLWENSWEEFTPFLSYEVEIRTVICSTDAIGSLNARYRRAVRARGHFPTEAAPLKCLYLVTRSLDPTGAGRTRGTVRWRPR